MFRNLSQRFDWTVERLLWQFQHLKNLFSSKFVLSTLHSENWDFLLLPKQNHLYIVKKCDSNASATKKDLELPEWKPVIYSFGGLVKSFFGPVKVMHCVWSMWFSWCSFANSVVVPAASVIQIQPLLFLVMENCWGSYVNREEEDAFHCCMSYCVAHAQLTPPLGIANVCVFFFFPLIFFFK